VASMVLELVAVSLGSVAHPAAVRQRAPAIASFRIVRFMLRSLYRQGTKRSERGTKAEAPSLQDATAPRVVILV
jgi:hypothetical protein